MSRGDGTEMTGLAVGLRWRTIGSWWLTKNHRFWCFLVEATKVVVCAKEIKAKFWSLVFTLSLSTLISTHNMLVGYLNWDLKELKLTDFMVRH